MSDPNLIAICKQQALAGDATALTALGDMYRDWFNRDDKTRREMATYWYQMAIDKHKYAPAMVHMYACAVYPCGIDAAKAMALLRRAVALGDTNAQALLGNELTLNQPGQDCKEGVGLLESAAKQGNPSAEAILGHRHTTGLCVRKDVNLPKQHYRAAVSIYEKDGYPSITERLISSQHQRRGVRNKPKQKLQQRRVSVKQESARMTNAYKICYVRL